ncbi:MAG: transcriptional regulator [Candidatus Kariarchaeaceae archaeon]|jgi:DNA-binding MarR family transcriptional regulator
MTKDEMIMEETAIYPISDTIPEPSVLDNTSISELTTQLFRYSFLLNPIRLVIIRILHDNDQVTSSELRKIMNISWGKFTSHIDTLIERGYINSSQHFINGSPKRVFYIEPIGRSAFLALKHITCNLF